jgi:hypothetical protein
MLQCSNIRQFNAYAEEEYSCTTVVVVLFSLNRDLSYELRDMKKKKFQIYFTCCRGAHD